MEGDLVAVPRERKFQHPLDKQASGLKRVPRVESACGLISDSLDPEIESPDSHLGDMRFYIEAFFDRFAGGM